MDKGQKTAISQLQEAMRIDKGSVNALVSRETLRNTIADLIMMDAELKRLARIVRAAVMYVKAPPGEHAEGAYGALKREIDENNPLPYVDSNGVDPSPDRAPLLAEVEAVRYRSAKENTHFAYDADRMMGRLAALLIEQDRRLFEANDAHEVATSECVRLREEVRVGGRALELATGALEIEAGRVRDLKRVLRPAEIGRIQAMAPEDRDDNEQLTLALWERGNRKRCVKFVADLATMSDIESDFLDGHELKGLARSLAFGDTEAVVPRLYGEEDAQRACSIWVQAARNGHTPSECVHLIAEALGLRRADA